jgi:hypothetical protein
MNLNKNEDFRSLPLSVEDQGLRKKTNAGILLYIEYSFLSMTMRYDR